MNPNAPSTTELSFRLPALPPLPHQSPSLFLSQPSSLSDSHRVSFPSESAKAPPSRQEALHGMLTYSIPHGLVRKPLTLVATDVTVRLLDGDQEVARHDRCWSKRQQIESEEHLDGLGESKRKAREHRGRNRLTACCPHATAFLEKIALHGGHLGGTTSRLLHLLDQYGREELDTAIAEATQRVPSQLGPWLICWSSANAREALPWRCCIRRLRHTGRRSASAWKRAVGCRSSSSASSKSTSIVDGSKRAASCSSVAAVVTRSSLRSVANAVGSVQVASLGAWPIPVCTWSRECCQKRRWFRERADHLWTIAATGNNRALSSSQQLSSFRSVVTPLK